MKVKELIEALQEQDQEAEVVLAADGEGNDYSPVSGYSSPTLYVPVSTWSGEIWDPEDVDHDDCDHDEDGDKDCIPEQPEGAIPCIVLWPTN